MSEHAIEVQQAAQPVTEQLKSEHASGVQQAAELQQVHAELRMDCESTSPEVCYCGACGDVYEEITDEVEDWIACDNCETWFHFSCVQINPVHVPEQFFFVQSASSLSTNIVTNIVTALSDFHCCMYSSLFRQLHATVLRHY